MAALSLLNVNLASLAKRADLRKSGIQKVKTNPEPIRQRSQSTFVNGWR
jgi:hypothetical protein